jgi:hypothetical protein
MKSKTFICHSSKDHAFVNKLAKRLKKEGVDVWIDDWEIKVGDSIMEKINEGLENSSFFVIVLSKNSRNSDWVHRELNATLMRQIVKKDVKILPLLLQIQAKALPMLLQDIRAVKFPNRKLEEAPIRELLEPILNERKAKLLREYEEAFLETVEHIDIILKKMENLKPSRTEIEFVLNIIEQEDYRNYFFRKADGVGWFKFLEEEGYFNPDDSLKPIKVEKGRFKIPNWVVLPYLERLSERLPDAERKQYVYKILHIIKNTSEFAKKNDLDNPFIGDSFVKILLNLHSNEIPLEIIDLIPLWLSTKFDTTIQGSDILMKLLPKFLPKDPMDQDIKKAEKILDYVTQFNTFEDPQVQSILLSRRYVKTLINPYWLWESFINQKIAQKIGEQCTAEAVYIVANCLKKIFAWEHQDSWDSLNLDGFIYWFSCMHRKDSFKIEIRKNPRTIEGPPEEPSMDNILPPKSPPIAEFEIENCHARSEFMEKAWKRTLETLRLDQELILANQTDLRKHLGRLYDNLFQDYSFIWLKSLEGDFGSPLDDIKEIFAVILRDIFLTKAKRAPQEAKAIFKKFLGYDYPYPFFRRLALFVIDKCWNDYNEVFWNFLDQSESKLIFDVQDFEVELFSILQNHVSEFTDKQKLQVKQILEAGPQRYLPRDNVEGYVTLWKQKWYSALSRDPQFGKLYEECKAKTGTDIKRPSHESGTVQVGPGKSPLTKIEILSMSPLDLANYLANFKPEDPFGDPSIGGLVNELRAAVREMPEYFIQHLDVFLNSAYVWVRAILGGFDEAWRSKEKQFEWGKLLSFIKNYINREDFWNGKFKLELKDLWNTDLLLIISMVGRLIQGGTKSDEWAFSPEHLELAQEILLLIMEKLQVKQEKEIIDAVSYAMNTPAGNILTALIFLALRSARVNKEKLKTKTVRWSPIKDCFDQALEKNILEAYTLTGQYMWNLYYLDEGWIKEKIKRFKDDDLKDDLWSAFMQGYLFPQPIKQLYPLMHDHYKKALDFPFKDRDAVRGLVNHIAGAYLVELEELPNGNHNGFLSSLLQSKDTEKIKMLIGLFWMQRDKLSKRELSGDEVKMKERIVAFWRHMYQKQKAKPDPSIEEQAILSHLGKLAIFLTKINEEKFKWLMLSALYVQIDFNSPYFIEYLNRLKERGKDQVKSAIYVGEIFIEMLKSFTPNYNKEHIREIVEHLFKQGDKAADLAKKICNTYGASGQEFLRDIYNKYKSKS